MAAGVQLGTATQFSGLSSAGSHQSDGHARVIPDAINNRQNQQIKRRNYHLKSGVIPGNGSVARAQFHTCPQLLHDPFLPVVQAVAIGVILGVIDVMIWFMIQII